MSTKLHHTYLDQGLSVLHARLRNPTHPTVTGIHPEVHPFITLSRETGAGATTLGGELIPLLDCQFAAPDSGWVFLDRDLLSQALTHHQLPTRLAEFLPEDRVSEIRAAIGELVGLHPSLWQLEQKVSEAILQLAHVGHVIFAGRASHLITRHVPGGVHVRLVAPLELRIARIATALHLSHADAAEHIEKCDSARRRFVRTNFAQDLDDPHLYDLVINTEHLAPATAAQLVLNSLRERLESARHQAPALRDSVTA